MNLDFIDTASKSDDDILASASEYYNSRSPSPQPILKKYYDISKILFHILLIMLLVLFNYNSYLKIKYLY
jgi:hypothetical protein